MIGHDGGREDGRTERGEGSVVHLNGQLTGGSEHEGDGAVPPLEVRLITS